MAQSVRTAITTDYDEPDVPLEKRLRAAAEAGIFCIHWCEDWRETRLYEPDELRQIVRLIEHYGLQVIDVHGVADDAVNLYAADDDARGTGIELMENRIALAAELGGDAVVVHPPPAGPDQDGALDRFALSLDWLEPKCQEVHVRLAIENLVECAPFEAIADRVFVRFAPDVVGFCFDSGHANITGELDLVSRYGDRLAALHLHDNDGKDDLHQLLGEGTVDWKLVADALRQARYDKPINLEVSVKNSSVRSASELLREVRRRADEYFGQAGVAGR